MERERAFNFKLLVPPRSIDNLGQVSAVKPQDICGFMPPLQGYNKCFDKESDMPFPNTSMVIPTKPTRADVTKKIAVMPMEKEETILKPSQLYSKLFEEADRIKCWKLRMDSEVVQKDRKLQENKRTIETQRKAIQELQFGNESLSMKLEDQIGENDDLRNKNNATRNLCNILKDTFERSAEKISLFESEREETHHLFMQNSENIQRMIAAFEGLRIQAETDQQEMLRVREGLQQFEDLKEKFEKEFNMKQEEIVMLQAKLRDKENDLKEIVLNLQETQESCNQLHEAARQHHEMFQSSKQEQEALVEKLQRAEQLKEESEENRKAIVNTLEINKEEYANILVEKDTRLEELYKIKDQQADQLAEIQATVQALKASLTSEIQRAKELEIKLSSISEELDKKNTELGKIKDQKEEKDNQIQTLKDEMDAKSDSIRALEERVQADETMTMQLTADLEEKNVEMNQFKNKVEIMSVENKNMEEALEKAKKEQSDLKYNDHIREVKMEEIKGQLSMALKNDDKSSEEIEKLKKDIELHEVKHGEFMATFNQLQLQKKTIQQQVEGEASKTNILESHLKETKANEEKQKMEIERLEGENQQLREELESLSTKIEVQRQDTENIQDKLEDCTQSSKNELMKKEKQIKALEQKLTTLKTKMENKTKAYDESHTENKVLKKQMAKANEKYSHLETEINELKEESNNIHTHHKEELQRICDDLVTKSVSEAQLQEEGQKLKQMAMEAVKSKEDAEMKCQHKISDMVALMEKHKNQYDKMVEETDAELDERRMKEVEINANKSSLELELSQLQIENGHLKHQLENENGQRENLKQEVEKLKMTLESQKKDHLQKEENFGQEILTLKTQIKSKTKEKLQEVHNEQMSEPKSKGLRGSETPKVVSAKRSTFEFSKEAENGAFSATPSRCTIRKVPATPLGAENEIHKTPSLTSSNRIGATPQIKGAENEIHKTPTWIGATPRIKSFRIRTPPSTEKAVPWGKSTLELDPKSDSSEQNDLLSFSAEPETLPRGRHSSVSGTLHHSVGVFKRVQSPAVHKSPGAALKLAAMKRMRDAGWTAVTSFDKKKKKSTEKIFA